MSFNNLMNVLLYIIFIQQILTSFKLSSFDNLYITNLQDEHEKITPISDQFLLEQIDQNNDFNTCSLSLNFESNSILYLPAEKDSGELPKKGDAVLFVDTEYGIFFGNTSGPVSEKVDDYLKIMPKEITPKNNIKKSLYFPIYTHTNATPTELFRNFKSNLDIFAMIKAETGVPPEKKLVVLKNDVPTINSFIEIDEKNQNMLVISYMGVLIRNKLNQLFWYPKSKSKAADTVVDFLLDGIQQEMAKISSCFNNYENLITLENFNQDFGLIIEEWKTTNLIVETVKGIINVEKFDLNTMESKNRIFELMMMNMSEQYIFNFPNVNSDEIQNEISEIVDEKFAIIRNNRSRSMFDYIDKMDEEDKMYKLSILSKQDEVVKILQENMTPILINLMYFFIQNKPKIMAFIDTYIAASLKYDKFKSLFFDVNLKVNLTLFKQTLKYFDYEKLIDTVNVPFFVEDKRNILLV